MTDHRVTDLFYGHLGELSYNPNESVWMWSRAFYSVQAAILQPFDQYAPSSIQHIPKGNKRPSRIARENLRRIMKYHPEVFPANLITATLGATHFISDFEPSYRIGSLLAIGHAVDYASASGSRRPQIMAIPCGEAGHNLKLVRPRYHSLGWGPQSSALLKVMGPEFSESGQWVGTGGRILQISFAEDVHGSSAWLAVRQSATTTIFRPLYSRIGLPNRAPSTPSEMTVTSSIIPNPVAVLTSDISGSQCLVDVSFNPWYSRQFAVVDELGSWSVWDIEGHINSMSDLKLVRGSSGSINDEGAADLLSKPKTPRSQDGWHRILWAANVTTIVICDRRNVAIIDVKGKPRRVVGGDLLAISPVDTILDIKRSGTSLSNLFVLTSSRIFWLEVISPAEEKDSVGGPVGARIILSYRHYRDGSDETLKLTAVSDERVSIIISSSKRPMCDLYCFGEGSGKIGRPIASRILLRFSRDLDNKHELLRPVQTMYFLPVPLKSGSTQRSSRQELRYKRQDVKFYQALAVAPDLGLWSSLCALRSNNFEKNRPSIREIMPPTTTLSRRFNYSSSRYVIEEPFIVPHALDNDFALFSPHRGSVDASGHSPSSRTRRYESRRLTLDWNHIFQQVFLEDSHANRESSDKDHDVSGAPTITLLLQSIRDYISMSRSASSFGMSTLLELASGQDITEDLDQFALTMSDFLGSIQREQDVAHSLRVTDIVQGVLPFSSGIPEVMELYDQLVDIWIACLPLEVPGIARLSMFKSVRKIAIEMCLSSITVSPQVSVPVIAAEQAEPRPRPKVKQSVSHKNMPAFYSSEGFSQKPEGNFSLTPAQTSSIYSSNSNAAAEDQDGDPAISRLRKYAVSIASQPAPLNSSLLSHWPSVPGADPSKYSWEAAKEASGAADDADSLDHIARREEARRRKRTEKFPNRDKGADTDASSISGYTQTGSQPTMAHHTMSLQATEEHPMTQPDRGVFGSRTAPKSVKKKKQAQRRAAGF